MKADFSARTPVSFCANCGYRMNAATNVHGGESIPDEGSFSICLNCGQLLIYQADLSLRKPTREEVAEVMKDAEGWATIEKARSLIERRGQIPNFAKKEPQTP